MFIYKKILKILILNMWSSLPKIRVKNQTPCRKSNALYNGLEGVTNWLNGNFTYPWVGIIFPWVGIILHIKNILRSIRTKV